MIYIAVLEKYWSPGEEFIKDFSKDEKLNFHKFIAYEYHKELHKAIENKRLEGKWMSNSFKFLRYKLSNKLSVDIHEFIKILEDQMTISKRSNLYIVGYLKKTHKETNLSYLKLAKLLEFGTMKMVPIPLYRYVLKYINTNIKSFYERYKKEKREND